MSESSTLRESLIKRFSGLRDNTIVIDNVDNFQIAEFEKAILIAYVSWSGPGLVNSLRAIRVLYENEYAGKIIVMDIDIMTPDFQIELFGQVSHGWGEIFVIQNGKILEKYLGKNSFANFKNGKPYN